MRKKIIFFTGAGISQESGIPTFRGSEDSLWSKYDVNLVASRRGLDIALTQVLDFHNDARKLISTCEPNYAHKVIAELEKDHDVTVITTNIDNLHERAGSTNVIHLHGNVFEVCDWNKDNPYEWNEDIKEGDLHPITKEQLRHNTVLFEEQLPVDIPHLYKNIVRKSNHLIIIGSSLQVYPSANITQYNKNIIYLNPEPCGLYDFEWKKIFKSAVEGIDEVKQLIA